MCMLTKLKFNQFSLQHWQEPCRPPSKLSFRPHLNFQLKLKFLPDLDLNKRWKVLWNLARLRWGLGWIWIWRGLAKNYPHFLQKLNLYKILVWTYLILSWSWGSTEPWSPGPRGSCWHSERCTSPAGWFASPANSYITLSKPENRPFTWSLGGLSMCLRCFTQCYFKAVLCTLYT